MLPPSAASMSFASVLAPEDNAISSPVAYLFRSLRSADDVQCFHSGELGDGDDVLSHGRVGRGLPDPVAGHEGNVSVQ